MLDTILQPELYPDLYGNLYHKVRINYYPPRGDNKEGWDNIDIFGWCGCPCRSRSTSSAATRSWPRPWCWTWPCSWTWPSAPACPAASRSGCRFYFKSPVMPAGLYPEHDLFIQQTKLKNTLRWMMGEELITHLGREYYDE